ncbi:uncharacterized protein LOC112450266 [Kryptolebias marmoratus]|uniref:uncharacterized protein LOC112450266 n=1 Tax=Kryptolebias marmoratus TaxID=37003 RepID=UPI000D52FCFA|nr:uncharacterized protein LOC112450266 [Kryptolebias marmoratus]
MLVIICLLMMLRDKCCADDGNIDTKIIHVGDQVKMTCPRRSAGNIFWMRIVFGNSSENLEKPSVGLYSHIIVAPGAGTLELKITKATKNDSAIYLCVRNYQKNTTYLKATYLRVKELELAVTRAPSSVSVGSKDSVTLQCSVLRDFKNTSCPVDNNMYCFRAELIQTHSNVGNAQLDEGIKYKNTSEGITAKKCFYSYLKNFSFSGVQMYSCDQALSEETRLKNKSRLNNEGVNTQDAKNYNTVLYLLCGALAICLVIIAFLIYLIKQLEKKAKGNSNATAGLEAPLGGNQESQQIDEELVVYSAPVHTKRKTSKSVRRSTSEEQEAIYTEVNIVSP